MVKVPDELDRMSGSNSLLNIGVSVVEGVIGMRCLEGKSYPLHFGFFFTLLSSLNI